jgi:hypothetical protein
LFSSNAPSPARSTDGMAPPVPPAPIRSAGNAPAARGGLDGWMLNNLFGRR